METSMVQFNRTFQLWSYLVSHGQLLLRSTKDRHHTTQVDVLFKNVAFLQLPTQFSKLVVTKIAEADIGKYELNGAMLPLGDRKCFRVKGDNWDGIVIAGHISWIENDAEHYMESELMLGY